jgi:hypothetical protein
MSHLAQQYPIVQDLGKSTGKTNGDNLGQHDLKDGMFHKPFSFLFFSMKIIYVSFLDHIMIINWQ